MNLLSLSALIDQLEYQLTLEKKICLIHERMNGRKLRRRTKHIGLRYMDREVSLSGTSHILDVLLGGSETMAMFHHCHMGHIAFDKKSKVFPVVMHGVDKSKLTQYKKHINP